MSEQISPPTRRRVVIALALLGITSLGCGAGSEIVEGTVTLNGKAVPGAHLTLQPNDDSLGGPFTGVTDMQGKFSMGSRGDAGAGVPPGVYELTIKTAPGDEAEDAPATRELIPAEAQVRALEVPEGGLPQLDLQLTSESSE